MSGIIRVGAQKYSGQFLVESMKVPTILLDKIERRLAALEKRAKDFGCVDIVTIGEPEFVPTSELGPKWKDKLGEFALVEVVDVTVNESDIRIPGGWRMIAVGDIVTAPGEVLVFQSPWNRKEVSPGERERLKTGLCDHCKTNRRRKSVYVLEDENGQRVHVGSTCAKDYLGHDAAALVNGIVNAWLGIYDVGNGGLGDIRPQAWSLETVIAATLAETNNGVNYVSRAKAEENFLVSTADAVSALLGDKEALLDAIKEFGDRAKALIAEAKTALPGETSNYALNLAAVVKAGVVTRKSIGLAASLVAYVQRLREAKSKRVEERKSAYIGSPGKRITIRASVKSVREWAGGYGTVTYVKLIDDSGNELLWRTNPRTADWAYDAVDGEPIELVATVKAHKLDEYRGRNVKVTHITRAKLKRA